MTATLQVATVLALAMLILPGAFAARMIVARTNRRAAALVLATAVAGIGAHALTLAGLLGAGGVVRVFGTVGFGLIALALLTRESPDRR